MEFELSASKTIFNLEKVCDFIEICCKTLKIDKDPVEFILIQIDDFDAYSTEDVKFCGLFIELDEHRNSFDVWVNKYLSEFEILATICHELCHVKQVVFGDLVIKDNNDVVWKKKLIKNENTSYETDPWEIEAFEFENTVGKQLIEEFLRNENTILA